MGDGVRVDEVRKTLLLRAWNKEVVLLSVSGVQMLLNWMSAEICCRQSEIHGGLYLRFPFTYPISTHILSLSEHDGSRPQSRLFAGRGDKPVGHGSTRHSLDNVGELRTA